EFEAVTSLPRNEFLWSFNGVVQTASRRTSYAFASRGVFRACVEQSGCKTKRCQNIAAGNAVGCPINFNYTTTPVFRLDTLDLGTVTVEWIQDGILYSSRTKSQGEEGRFVISNREPYEKNAAGEATVQMDIGIKSWLYSSVNDSIQIDLPNVHWALAYPE
ncbi:MAG: hypothetical protein AB8F95_01470, partial [Bacteroidia bacterium]